MKCYGRTLDLRGDPNAIASYKDWHRRVFPEVLDALRAIGVTRMKIFVRGTRMFMYMEAVDSFDPRRDWSRYAALPRTAEWEEMMRTLQQRLPGAQPDEWWAPMEQGFDLESA